MRRRFSSPRLRRRLRFAGVLSVLVALTATGIALLPEKSPPSPPPAVDDGPAAVAAPQRHFHLTVADRRQIDGTIDRFVQAAVLRKDPAVAWRLAGPELKTGSTLAEWRAGNTPVPYYPAKGRTFHDWTTIDISANAVELNLLVHPKPRTHLASYVFAGQVIRRGAGWLVNRWYTIAIMNPARGSTHEVGPADFQAPAASATPMTGPTRSGWWLFPVVGLLALVPLTGLGLMAAGLVRRRPWLRGAQAKGRAEMPPLPRSWQQMAAHPSSETDSLL